MRRAYLNTFNMEFSSWTVSIHSLKLIRSEQRNISENIDENEKADVLAKWVAEKEFFGLGASLGIH